MQRNDLTELLRLLQTHPNLGEPGVHVVEVRHDDGCPMLAGKGECTCKPVARAMNAMNAEPEAIQ